MYIEGALVKQTELMGSRNVWIFFVYKLAIISFLLTLNLFLFPATWLLISFPILPCILFLSRCSPGIHSCQVLSYVLYQYNNMKYLIRSYHCGQYKRLNRSLGLSSWRGNLVCRKSQKKQHQIYGCRIGSKHGKLASCLAASSFIMPKAKEEEQSCILI